MYAATVKSVIKAKGWSQSELARRVGVSRQAVSQWLASDKTMVRGDHLMRVSEVLGLPAESLMRPLPGFGPEHDELKARFLWDRLYPDLDDFAIAVNRRELEAVARLVQVSGPYVAERLVGRMVWTKFADYARYIHPARRRQLEGLVRWRTVQAVQATQTAN
jgi:transcriptional regulator with XRE-family HTH domain